jgi:ubiquitin-like modifier-activating enzyme ATG7
MTAMEFGRRPWLEIDDSFFDELYRLKLKVLKLSQTPSKVIGFVNPGSEAIVLSATSFSKHRQLLPSKGDILSEGAVICVNSEDDFNAYDRQALVAARSHLLWRAIVEGDANKHPSLLRPFILLVYADLKTRSFKYWAAFPSLCMPGPSPLVMRGPNQSPPAPAAVCPSARILQTTEKFLASQPFDLVFCLLKLQRGSPCSSTRPSCDTSPHVSFCDASAASSDADTDDNDDAGTLESAPPERYGAVSLREGLSSFSVCKYSMCFGFVDTVDTAAADTAGKGSNRAVNQFSFALRNLLVLVAYHTSRRADREAQNESVSSGNGNGGSGIDSVEVPNMLSDISFLKVYCQLDAHGKLECDQARSVCFVVNLPYLQPADMDGPSVCPLAVEAAPTAVQTYTMLPSSGVPGQDLAQAAELNLRLMTWRHSPDLDIDAIVSSRCLLIGAGTLGCAVARILVGWGVTDITFVDRGDVGPSNPARQCLFTAQDIGNMKAVAAARRLNEVMPSIRAKGEVLSVPQPSTGGLLPGEEAEAGAAMARLEILVKNSHVVFNLTDSREGRWVITVLCACFDRLCITSALGFDSFLAMRHGRRHIPEPSGDVLGLGHLTAAQEMAQMRAAGRGAWVGPIESDGPNTPTHYGSMSVPHSQPNTSSLGCYFCRYPIPSSVVWCGI